MQFCTLIRVTGEAIAKEIRESLKALDLDIKNLRGQGYDGAANMASERVGVQSLIRKDAPLATYTHCSGHCLNLVIVHSCKLLCIKNTLDRMQAVCTFFLNSPKRNGLLVDIVGKCIPTGSKRKALIDLCRTRWAERQNAYQHFYQCFTFVVTALEVIALSLHHDDMSDDFRNCKWDNNSKNEANSLLHVMTSFEFVISFLIAYQYLSPLAGVTVSLQSRTKDIVSAYQSISETEQYYRDLRLDMDQQFTKVFQQAVRLAVSLGIEPSKPRNCGRQQHRANAEATTVEAWYRVNVAIPFVDHLIEDIGAQFCDLSRKAARLLGLVPSIICAGEVPDLDETIDKYAGDLPSPELLSMELDRWKRKFMSLDAEQRPSSCAKAIKACDKAAFPNIFILLQIACTLPVTSCECERNASVLRRLRNFMRAGMTELRLSSLALMHIHYEFPINLDDVVTKFSEKHPRRMQLKSVLCDD